jgi:YegS/Rv2252/BmrU family lipid kinase
LLVYNPKASFGRAKKLLPAVVGRLQRFAVVDVHLTRAPGDATRYLAAADPGSFDGVLAAGGDGTLFETLNGLYAHEASVRPPLGLVPVGTGNAFSRDLGLEQGEWEQAIGLVEQGTTRRVDVGRVESAGASYHFVNIIGAGLPADTLVTTGRIKFTGRAAYNLATLWQAMRMKSHRMVMRLDGVETVSETIFIEIANTRFTGSSFLIAPDACMDDGYFDIVEVSPLSRLRLLRLFPTIYSGRHVEHGEVRVRRAREIRIESPAGLALAADGELLGRTPAVIRCLHRDLELFAP